MKHLGPLYFFCRVSRKDVLKNVTNQVNNNLLGKHFKHQVLCGTGLAFSSDNLHLTLDFPVVFGFVTEDDDSNDKN